MALLGSPFANSECNENLAFPCTKDNPRFTIEDFKFWIPEFSEYVESRDGKNMFNRLKKLANEKILYSVFGVDWQWAMSLCVAHYATIIGKQMNLPVGQDLGQVAMRGGSTGVLTGMTVGGFSKTYDLDRSMSNNPDAKWWNQTKYGQALYNLFESKPVFTMLVVTNNHVPGSGNL